MSLIVSPVIARLKDPSIAGGAVNVAGIGALAAVANSLKANFELFVLRMSSTAAPSTTATMVTRQTVTTSFEVIGAMQLAHLRTTPDLIDTASADIVGRLLGWSHPAAEDPVEFRSDRLIEADFAKGQLLWGWLFSFTRIIQE